ncbi:MAG: hypothetical protein H0Z19_09395 [Archaeoglobus sp.]|uniref:hypothetical protein n=1 Tax=Archaeoglobus sp. TaxID=1872626 RepID=UPI001DA69984|nr:hypothetical protein [Archaeoglobus sp.]MBO8180670.1 hypothetical protein [Archaeoglobus sp.]
MENVVRKVLEEYCAWAGRDLEEYVQQAVYERLKGDLEEVASHGIPRAEEMLRRLLEA